jgi:GTP-binding protein
MPAKFIKSATNLDELPKGDKPHIALVGRSNVGKSSLLNHLTNQKGLARESAEPGRTQSINIFEVNNRYYLIDLPGYGFAKTSKDKREGMHDMIDEYIGRAEQLKLVLLIIDARRGLTDLDLDMMSYLTSCQINYILIVNKIDKLSKSESASLMQKLEASCPDVPRIAHSNVTRQGAGEILEAIERAIRIL